ncbi:hypothetical protein HK102_006113 [Quaeritorhiza haematococci]|nr:hypothetical protein HK102_006113 [Quaeritorhiza haematococci]
MYYQPWPSRTLRRFLDKRSINGTIQQLAAQFMLCLSRALHFLYTSRPPIVPCDLTPDNLWLTENDEIVLIDFGLEKKCVNAPVTSRTPSTQDNRYMAPEILKGASHNQKAGVFTLGAIFLELFTVLTGVRAAALYKVRKNWPYGHEKTLERVQKWMDALVTSNATVDAEVTEITEYVHYREIISMMMEEKPENRVHGYLRELHTTYTCCADELYEDEAER